MVNSTSVSGKVSPFNGPMIAASLGFISGSLKVQAFASFQMFRKLL
jgi:hypothetical protein